MLQSGTPPEAHKTMLGALCPSTLPRWLATGGRGPNQGGSTLKWVWVSLLVFLGAKMTAWPPHVKVAVLHACSIYYGELKFEVSTLTCGGQGVCHWSAVARFWRENQACTRAAGAQAQ
jgi:hypothetical protein